MIELTRLNNQRLAVNSDLIKFVENAPDTVITLINGEKVIVKESAGDIISRIVAFRRLVLAGLCEPVSAESGIHRPGSCHDPTEQSRGREHG